MTYPFPGDPSAPVQFKAKYDNFIGGKWVPPVKGQYFDNITPITGKVFCQAARSTAEDIELALDAAHAAKEKWGKTPPAQRAQVLLAIADRLEQNLENSPTPRRWTTASRSAKPLRPTFRSPSITSATSPAASAPKKGRSPRSTKIPSPTTSTSRWAWSVRSFPGTSPS